MKLAIELHKEDFLLWWVVKPRKWRKTKLVGKFLTLHEAEQFVMGY